MFYIHHHIKYDCLLSAVQVGPTSHPENRKVDRCSVGKTIHQMERDEISLIIGNNIVGEMPKECTIFVIVLKFSDLVILQTFGDF